MEQSSCRKVLERASLELVTDERRYDEWAKEQRLISRINEEERLKCLSKQDIANEAWKKDIHDV